MNDPRDLLDDALGTAMDLLQDAFALLMAWAAAQVAIYLVTKS